MTTEQEAPKVQIPRPKKIYRNLTYLADVNGTGFWRHIQQILQIGTVQRETGIVNSYMMVPVNDPNYYNGVNSVTIQRWITDAHKKYVEDFLRPVTKLHHAALVYEIDDAMHYEDIPKFNRGYRAFADDKVQENIKYMLNASDFVVVTTKHIKEYYNRRYGVPMEKLVAVPNLLPHWWYGDKYYPELKVAQFDHFKSKPRIGIISSLSHYNLDAVKDEKGELVKDDFDEIADLVRSTVDDFQWVVMGYVPPQVKDLVDANKVKCYPPVSILDYPSALGKLQLQAVVAPLQNIEFNNCKSHIKYMECAALGIPLFASHCLPYSAVMPREQMFDTQDELKDKLMKLKFASSGAYRKMVEAQWNWLNSEHEEGDFKVKNCWLEDNMEVWYPLFTLEPTGFKLETPA